MMTNPQTAQTDTIWVLVDAPEGGDLARYAGPKQIDIEKLGEHFQSFTSAIARSLAKCKSLGGKNKYELTEITIEAKLTAEAGFALVSKAGVEGTVGFKFEKCVPAP